MTTGFRTALALVLLVAGSSAPAQFTYQRHRSGMHHGPLPPQYAAPWVAPTPVQGGFYQRPYPYHLDYYRMRYGGSYAPYFGNLYGPPNVVLGWPGYGSSYGGPYATPYAVPLDSGSPMMMAPVEVPPTDATHP